MQQSTKSKKKYPFGLVTFFTAVTFSGTPTGTLTRTMSLSGTATPTRTRTQTPSVCPALCTSDSQSWGFSKARQDPAPRPTPGCRPPPRDSPLFVEPARQVQLPGGCTPLTLRGGGGGQASFFPAIPLDPLQKKNCTEDDLNSDLITLAYCMCCDGFLFFFVLIRMLFHIDI